MLTSIALGQAQAPASPSAPAPAPAPEGTVLFERSTPAAANPEVILTEPAAVAPPQLKPRDVQASPAAQSQAVPPDPAPAMPDVTDADRSALAFSDYDLDARITPATGGLAMRTRLTVRNRSAAPLTHLALQISSTLHWETVTLVEGARRVALSIDQHQLATDADHTGEATEVVLTLPTPLAPGASVVLDAFYTGKVVASGGRLERLGATPAQAATADWDSLQATPEGLSSSATDSSASADFGPALRGFGDVLWYPVAAPQLFLGDGNRLFAAIAQQRADDAATTIRLRLAVLYSGEPPVAVYFCGRRQALVALADDPDTPVVDGSGIATAEFAAQPLGFRAPSLFVIDRAETLLAPLPAEPGAEAAGAPLLAVVSADEHAEPLLAESAQTIAPLLVTWLGTHPLSALTVLDHAGQPFEDGPLLVGPVATLGASSSAAALTHSLTHAWVQTGRPWIDDGLAQFFALLWVEQQQGRAVSLAQETDLLKPLALVEPALTAESAEVGQPLITATDEVYYRRKSAAVFLQLRALVGEPALQQALRGWLPSLNASQSAAEQAGVLQRLLETASHKDLGWFFADWVLRDRGLPDLTIADVTPRLLPAGKGHDSGWLVAVTVRNDGAAAAEVPLTVRSGSFTITRQLRVPGLASVTDRVLTEAAPTQVVLNDGTVPEVRLAVHTVDLTLKKE